MYYLIDGYNLLHHVGLLHSGKIELGPLELEKARLALLGRLWGHYGDESHNVTVVFDASGAPAGVSGEQEYQGIQIWFTRDEEADDLIERIIRRASAPHLLTVVSDDRRIRDAARRRDCPVIECIEFWELLAHRESPPRAESAVPPAKSGALSAAEVERWLEEFGDVADDAAFKELFDLPESDDPPAP